MTDSDLLAPDHAVPDDTVPEDAGPGRGGAARLRRDLAVMATVGLVAFELVSAYLEPRTPDDPAALVASLAAHPVRALLSSLAFVLAMPAQIGMALGVAHLVRHRAPRLGVVGALLLVLGSCGDLVNAGINLGIVALSRAGSDAALVMVAGRLHQAHPVLIFALVGLAGTVVGVLLLSVAVFRAHAGPRWVGPALWAFLLVEFVGSAIYAPLAYVSVLLAAAAYLALAREVRRVRW